MGNWTLQSIAWDRFDPSKVDPEILRNIKAAAMVERNGSDYAIYLSRVFADDPGAVEDVRRQGIAVISLNMAGSVPDAADLVVSEWRMPVIASPALAAPLRATADARDNRVARSEPARQSRLRADPYIQGVRPMAPA